MYTPWGVSDHSNKIAHGIVFYSTPSHGGYHLSKKVNLLVPAYMRNENGWYEEDCESAIVHLVFAMHFPDHYSVGAFQTLKDYFPDAFETLTGEKVKPEESYKRMQQMEPIIYANDYIVRAAWGDWHAKVPKGFVGVCATLGKDGRGVNERYFLVPAGEYKKDRPAGLGFIIDLSKHQEIEPLA